MKPVPRGACVVQVPGAVGRYSAGKRSEASPACGFFEFGSARDRSFFPLAVFYFFSILAVGRVIFFCDSFAGALFSPFFLLSPSLTVFYATIASFFRCDGAFMTCLRVFLCALMCLGHGPVPFSLLLQFFSLPACFSSRFFFCFFFLFCFVCSSSSYLSACPAPISDAFSTFCAVRFFVSPRDAPKVESRCDCVEWHVGLFPEPGGSLS